MGSTNIFSVKLVTGHNILAEIKKSDVQVPFLTLTSPITVRVVETQEGQSIVAIEYDPMSDETEFTFSTSNILSGPTVANKFYKEFYVNSLVTEFGRKEEYKIEDELDESDSVKMNSAIQELNFKVEQYAKELFEKFDVEVNLEDEEDDISEPTTKAILH